MNIVVCVKQTPDTTSSKHLTPQNRLDRHSAPGIVNTYDEPAIEEALRIKEEHGGDVAVLTMGPPAAQEVIRKALAMGADRGIHIVDSALEGSDAWVTARVLATALGRLAPDIVILGMQSDDAASASLAGAIAERTGLAQLTNTNKLTIDGDLVVAQQRVEDGYIELEARLPALIGVTDVINQPRYPSLKGIMAAKRKEIVTWNVADLGIDPSDVGQSGSHTTVVAATAPPPRGPGDTIVGDSDAARKIVDFMAARKLI